MWKASSEIFWNTAHVFDETRALDPLGLDALRAAMSNALVPYLTGTTRHAEHYVAVLVGLHWAKSRANSPVDREIWPHFARFERGLKMFWHRCPAGRPARRQYLGKRKIKELCSDSRPNVETPILRDERGIGLLANYVESLRAMGLVRPSQIVVDDGELTEVIGDPRFEWPGSSPSSWKALDSIFSPVDRRSAWPKLGRRLFDLRGLDDDSARMHAAARAVRERQRARSWEELSASAALQQVQRAIAALTRPTTELEIRLRSRFAVLLEGGRSEEVERPSQKVVRLAASLVDGKIFEHLWTDTNPLATVLEQRLTSLAAGKQTDEELLAWHCDITRMRGNDPWIREVGEKSLHGLAEERPEADFRFSNLCTLLAETRWPS